MAQDVPIHERRHAVTSEFVVDAGGIGVAHEVGADVEHAAVRIAGTEAGSPGILDQATTDGDIHGAGIALINEDALRAGRAGEQGCGQEAETNDFSHRRFLPGGGHDGMAHQ